MKDPLNKYQGKLNPAIFSNYRLKPEVRELILAKINGKNFPSQVKKVYILGSLTSFRWSNSSDLDVNIALEELPETWGKTHGMEDISGSLIPGTQHEINFYVSQYYPEMEENYTSADTNVYDVVADNWLKPYEQIAPTRPSSELYPAQSISYSLYSRIGNQLAQQFIERQGWNKAFAGENLMKLLDQVQQRRRDQYEIGAGIPRYSAANYGFKLLAKQIPATDAFYSLRSKLLKKHPVIADKNLYG